MIYLSISTVIEAKPIIKYLNLKKNNSFTKAQVFFNERITLVITGIGNIDAAIVLTYVFSKLNITPSDLLINIGVCFGKNCYNSGDVIICNKIINITKKKEFYPDMIYIHNFKEDFLENLLLTSDKNNIRNTLVDYESFGIYKSGSYFFDNHQMIFIKIFYCLDDYDLISNDKINEIINNSLESIFSWIFEISDLLKQNKILFSIDEKEMIDKFIEKFKFSVTMSIEFKNLLKYYKLNNKNISIDILLEKYFKEENIKEKIIKEEIISKKRGKYIFELIKKEIME
ncbi:MAG: spore photoproduct lyase [Fusobacteriaceae bacterium]|jgi:hypothetical protein|nr:spore photoproduct lyase [Fusobacteriaceae bacterium]